jgi:hypothetical protein
MFMDEELGRLWKESFVVLLVVLSSICLERLRKPGQTLGRRASVLAEDKIQDLKNMNQEC